MASRQCRCRALLPMPPAAIVTGMLAAGLRTTHCSNPEPSSHPARPPCPPARPPTCLPCRFQILNMRQPVQVVFLKGAWLNANKVVALSPLITFRQVHCAWRRLPLQYGVCPGACVARVCNWQPTAFVGCSTPTRHLLACRQSNLPTHARLAVTDTVDEMRVTWTTKDKPPSPTVMWGTSPGKYTGSAQGTSWTYTKADMCGAPANGTGW